MDKEALLQRLEQAAKDLALARHYPSSTQWNVMVEYIDEKLKYYKYNGNYWVQCPREKALELIHS